MFQGRADRLRPSDLTPYHRDVPSEPTIGDVLDRLDRVDKRFDSVDRAIATLGLEQRAGHAEVRMSIVELRQTVHDLGNSLRDLWTEHLVHEHPTEPGTD